MGVSCGTCNRRNLPDCDPEGVCQDNAAAMSLGEWKTCEECGASIEPLTSFPARNGSGVVCMPCYERRMEGVEFTAADVMSAFVSSVNV